jgi:lipoprotein-anchoring transpeptidase ErfK/SrfK
MCERLVHRLKVLLLVVSCLSLAHCAYLPWGIGEEPQPTEPVATPTKPKPPPPPKYADTQIVVDIDKQTLYLFKKAKLLKYYPISSSKFGIGNAQDSHKTPLGKHYIAHKIGANAPINTIFKARMNTQKVALINDETEEDVITSRILWLKGLEPGINKGPGIDSYQRYIYIHGTADEAAIGRPASFGCIRMKNQDVVDLFSQVEAGRYGTQVHIVPRIQDLKKPPLTGS